MALIRFVIALLLLLPALAEAQQVILTTREQQTLKALMGPGGTIEQLLITETAAQPTLSTTGTARIMATTAHTLVCSFNGGAYSACLGGSTGAPADAQYWVGAANGDLSAEKNLGALATALVINTAGVPSAYAGTTCTNQFPRSLSAVGAATCASVSLTADVTGTLPFGNLPTNVLRGSGTRGRPVTWTNTAGTVVDSTYYTDVVAGWGAVCDGTDQKTAIEAAIAAGVTRLYIPAGCKWIPTADLVPAGLEIMGGSWNSTTIASSDTVNTNLSVGNNTLIQNVRFAHKYCTDRPGTPSFCPTRFYQNTSGASSVVFSWPNQAIAIETSGTDQGSADRPGLYVNSYGDGDPIFVQTLGTGNGVTALRAWNSSSNANSSAILGARQTAGEGLRVQDDTAGAATGNRLSVQSSRATAGSFLQVFQSTDAFTGNALLMQMAESGGTFNSGNFINLQKAGSSVWLVAASGDTSLPNLLVKATSGTPGSVQFFDNDNSNFVGFKAPATVSVDRVWSLPATDGSNGDCLKTDGSNALSFSACIAPGAGITNLNGLTPATQTFAKVDDTNVTLAIASATSTHTFTVGWTGQLAASRGGTGVNNSNTITLGGNVTTAGAFTTSGANSLTLTTTGSTNVTLPTSGTLTRTADNLSVFAATSSAQLAGVINDETGTGLLVFGTAPTFSSTITVGTASTTTGQVIFKNSANANNFILQPGVTAASITFTLPTGDGTAGTCLSTNGSAVLGWANCSSGGTGLTSLNGQTGNTQTFANDTNVQISSAADTHTLAWAGTLATARGGLGGNFGASSGVLSINAGTVIANNVLTAGRVLYAGSSANTVTTTSQFSFEDDKPLLLINSSGGTLASFTPGGRVQISSPTSSAAHYVTDTFQAPGLVTFRRSQGSVGAPTALGADQNIGSVSFRGYGATGYGSDVASYGCFAGGTWTDSSQPTYCTWGTTPSASVTNTERMRMTSAGLIGVAVAAPLHQLEVQTNGLATSVAGFAVRYNASNNPFVIAANATSGLGWFGLGANQSTGNTHTYAITGATPVWQLTQSGTATNALRLQIAPGGTSGAAITWTSAFDIITTGDSLFKVFGVVESTSGGFKFPDATTQASAACIASGTCAWTGAHTWTQQAAITLLPFGVSTGNTSEIRWRELAANGVNYVGFKAPDSIATNVMWKLPISDGAANQCLKTDGAQNLSWTGCAAGITGSGAAGQLTYWTGATAQSGNSAFAVDATNIGVALSKVAVNTVPLLGLTVTNTGPSFLNSRPLRVVSTVSGTRVDTGSGFVDSNNINALYAECNDTSTSDSAQLGDRTSVCGMIRAIENPGFTGTAYGSTLIYEALASPAVSTERGAALMAMFVNAGAGNIGAYAANSFLGVDAAATSLPLGIIDLSEMNCRHTDCGSNAFGKAVQNVSSLAGTSIKAAAGLIILPTLKIGGGGSNAWTHAIQLGNYNGSDLRFRVDGDGAILTNVPTGGTTTVLVAQRNSVNLFQVDSNVAGSETPVILNFGGTLYRVKVGANGTCGAGTGRCLFIDN